MSRQKNTPFPESISPILATLQDSVVIVACSGGVDSMVLIDILRKYQVQNTEYKIQNCGFVVAHIHHGLRDTADRDEHIVRDYCEKYSLPLEVLHTDVKKESKTTKTSIEECARNIRKEWLEKIREKHKANYILTAHHSDDQAETVLYRVIKGTGMTGLSGIAKNAGHYLRPLLNCPKESLIEYARANHLVYGHDETNDDTSIPRNLLRHTVLPDMEKINSEVRTSLIRLGKNAEILKCGFDEFFRDFGNSISYDEYHRFPLAFQHELLRYWYEEKNGSTHGLSTALIEELDRFLSTRNGGKKEFGKVWIVKKSGIVSVE